MVGRRHAARLQPEDHVERLHRGAVGVGERPSKVFLCLFSCCSWSARPIARATGLHPTPRPPPPKYPAITAPVARARSRGGYIAAGPLADDGICDGGCGTRRRYRSGDDDMIAGMTTRPYAGVQCPAGAARAVAGQREQGPAAENLAQHRASVARRGRPTQRARVGSS